MTRTLALACAAGGAVALTTMASTPAPAAPAVGGDGYRLVVVADSVEDRLATIGCASINNGGDIAYRATKDLPRRSLDVIFRRDRGSAEPVVIARDPDVFDFLGNPVLNDRGQVGFSAVLEDGEAILRGTSGELTEIARTERSRFNFFASAVSMNEAGRIAFKAELDERLGFAEGMFSGAGGAVRDYYTNADSDFDGTSALASINDAGTVAFGESIDNRNGIFVTRPDGGFRTVSAPREGVDVDDVTQNDERVLAFERFTVDDTGGITRTQLVTGQRRGALTVVADTAEQFTGFGFRPPAINDAGQVAYAADLDTGGSGVYVGPEATPVVETGGTFDGDPIASTVLCENGLDDSGRLAIVLNLDDPDAPQGFRDVLVRAVPRG